MVVTGWKIRIQIDIRWLRKEANVKPDSNWEGPTEEKDYDFLSF